MAEHRTWRRSSPGVLAGVAIVLAFVMGGVLFLIRGNGTSDGGPSAAARTTAAATSSPDGSASSSPEPKPTTASAVLAALAADGSPEAAQVRAALGALVSDPALGGSPGVSVIDAATGASLVDIDSSGARTPASTTKLLTAAAALEVLGPDATFKTRIVSSGVGDLVLVGGGDPALSQRTASDDDWPYAVTPLADLATATVAALRAQGVATVRLAYAADLFSGPAVSPDWPASYVSSGQVGPISALSLDGSRRTPGMAARVEDPAAYVAERFAALLVTAGIATTVIGAAPTPAAGASELAVVASPPVSNLVSQMLLRSDNDVAETLARQVARVAGQPASFAGIEPAITGVLTALSVSTDGLDLFDGSGLSRKDLISPATLTATLLAAIDPGHDELRPLLSGLPVAGFNGTLAARFDDRSAAVGSGDIRAKTGYLSGVVALAGYVRDQDDQLLVFAFVTDEVPSGSTVEAQTAVDDLAMRLAACGCT